MPALSQSDSRRATLAALLAWLALPLPLLAQPVAKPVHIVVPFSPGGGADIVARVLAQKLQERWRQSVIVENRPGANGAIAADAVMRAPADGTWLMLGSVGTHAINAGLYPKLAYDPLKDFAPVAMVGKAPNLLVVNAALPVRSVAELITLARDKPGAISYASSGNGSSQHLSAEVFQNLAVIKLIHVPYRGASQALPDIISGLVQVAFTGLTTTMPYVKSGQLRALAVTTAERSAALPDVPTVAEAGLTGFESLNWLALFAPAATPSATIARLNADIVDVLNTDATVRARMDPDGFVFDRLPPDEVRAFVQSEITKWRGVIERTGVRAD